MVRRMSGRGGGHIFWHSTQTELMNEARYLTSQTHVAFRHSQTLINSKHQTHKLQTHQLTNSKRTNS